MVPPSTDDSQFPFIQLVVMSQHYSLTPSSPATDHGIIPTTGDFEGLGSPTPQITSIKAERYVQSPEQAQQVISSNYIPEPPNFNTNPQQQQQAQSMAIPLCFPYSSTRSTGSRSPSASLDQSRSGHSRDDSGVYVGNGGGGGGGGGVQINIGGFENKSSYAAPSNSISHDHSNPSYQSGEYQTHSGLPTPTKDHPQSKPGDIFSISTPATDSVTEGTMQFNPGPRFPIPGQPSASVPIPYRPSSSMMMMANSDDNVVENHFAPWNMRDAPPLSTSSSTSISTSLAPSSAKTNGYYSFQSPLLTRSSAGLPTSTSSSFDASLPSISSAMPSIMSGSQYFNGNAQSSLFSSPSIGRNGQQPKLFPTLSMNGNQHQQQQQQQQPLQGQSLPSAAFPSQYQLYNQQRPSAQYVLQGSVPSFPTHQAYQPIMLHPNQKLQYNDGNQQQFNLVGTQSAPNNGMHLNLSNGYQPLVGQFVQADQIQPGHRMYEQEYAQAAGDHDLEHDHTDQEEHDHDFDQYEQEEEDSKAWARESGGGGGPVSRSGPKQVKQMTRSNSQVPVHTGKWRQGIMLKRPTGKQAKGSGPRKHVW